ncbi:branched-chain amino acid ABC transporter permease [Clostridium sp. Marseille-P299]|uniref:branched-chain amino acid ABC transporter permease n=1 Tax=Clostridium sp. Marseille-P299 TaxID=1805477 RepID=UPI000836A1C4|nr:branched-chain amino acid ABC transporter permease [Clostridium sp. Marseille-P299]
MGQIILQLIIGGLAMGFIYALVSIEYTIIWNASGLLNFSHERLILLGAYIFGAQFVVRNHMDTPIAVILMLVTTFFIGVAISYFLMRPLRNMPLVFSVTGTIMLGRIITEGVRIIWGNNPIPMVDWLQGTIQIGELVISKTYIIIIAVAAILVAILQLFLNKTKVGTAMRCVSQNKKAAAFMGIDVDRSSAITMGISAVICAIIGILIIPLFQLKGDMTGMIGLKGFAAGVVGGFGYLPGGIIGGILIGVLESLSTLVVPGIYKDTVSFILLIVFLLVKPSGILGHKA